MSEKKKVIHVKDLVIKADNVYVEPTHPHRRPRHEKPFFRDKKEENRHRNNENEDKTHDKGHDDHPDERDNRNRRPFSWI